MITLSELRQNILTREWVLYAENRKKRPYDFVRNVCPRDSHTEECPFCGGNEQRTTEALYQDGENGDWSIRVFPNRFPAVTEQEEPLKEEGFYTNVVGKGRHEVLVDTPEHEGTIENFTTEHLKKVLVVLQERYLDIRKGEMVRYVQIFKNCGSEAGMSLRHSHWQIIGLPVVSGRAEAYSRVATDYEKETEHCIFCDMIEVERKENNRLIRETDTFFAFAPYASRFPYEIWIAPKEHVSYYGQFSEKNLGELSELLKDMLLKVKQIQENVSYNICFMDAPKGEIQGSFHWYVQILPRIGGFAGFEYATDICINPVLPETAAAFFKSLI